jgi:hypothetical protein
VGRLAAFRWLAADSVLSTARQRLIDDAHMARPAAREPFLPAACALPSGSLPGVERAPLVNEGNFQLVVQLVGI